LCRVGTGRKGGAKEATGPRGGSSKSKKRLAYLVGRLGKGELKITARGEVGFVRYSREGRVITTGSCGEWRAYRQGKKGKKSFVLAWGRKGVL